jgi:uncharacterized membrane protein
MDHALERPARRNAIQIRHVDTLQPLVWLQEGREDMARIGWPSLAHGVFITGFGALLLALAWGAGYLMPAFIGGFLLVAPFVAIGLYALSAQVEAAPGPVDAGQALFAWRRNAGSIGLFGLMLAMFLLLWERLSAIVFALSYGGKVPDLSAVVRDVIFSGQHVPLLLAFVGLGAVLALMVFTLSVVSAPLLLDRPVDAITAAITSMRCCLANPRAMALWAALVAGLTVLGFATAMIGLIWIFPLLGHATWHAYRDLVH